MDFTGRLIAAVIALILVIIFPLQYIAQSNNENFASLVDDRTKSLSDSIRDKGYLDSEMYEEYISFLDTTGELYDVEIEDIHPVTGDDITTSEVPYPGAVAASVDVHNGNRFSQLKYSGSNNKASTLPAGSHKENSLLNSAISDGNQHKGNEIKSLATHTHTSDCYAGHNHTASGCVPGYHCSCGTEPLHISRGYSGSYYIFSYVCPTCGNTIVEISVSTEGDYQRYHVYAVRWDKAWQKYTLVNICYCYINNGTTETIGDIEAYNTFNILNNYGSYTISYNSLYTNYPIFNKPLPNDGYYNKYYDINPPFMCPYENDPNLICDRVVTSITPTNPVQTVKKGDSIITTATATYLDGHTGIVNCTSNFNPNITGVQSVTLTYSGLVANAKTTGTITCLVSITVRLDNIPAYLIITPSQTTVYNGTEPSYLVIVYYESGTHKEILTAYSKTGWSPGPGTKNVTFSYTENGKTVYTNVTITVKPNLTGITVSPVSQTVERYRKPSFMVMASYEDGSSKEVTAYTISGLSTDKTGTQNVIISYVENGLLKNTPVEVVVTNLQKTCPVCGTKYTLNDDDSSPGCPVCSKILTGIKVEPEQVTMTKSLPLNITVKAVYRDGHEATINGWTSNYDMDRVGLQKVTVKYGEYTADISVLVEDIMIICPVCSTQYPASQLRCPVCSENVIRLDIMPGTVTVNQNEPINITVTAYYADGYSEAVTDWSIDRTSSEPGTYSATVSYKNAAATVNLTVISPTAEVCPICGLIYEPSENPRGCPVCSGTITGIEAYLTSGSYLVQYGSKPGIAVVSIYRDTHRELATDGYILENYDAQKLGNQTVTIRYKGFSTNLNIVVVNNISGITCPNGHVYYRNEDGTDPGCPYCAATGGTGIVYYFEITYTEEILEKVYMEGAYSFDKGNYMTLTVTGKDKSILSRMQKTFFKTSLLGRKKRFIYGGGVF